MDGAWLGSIDIAINKAFTAKAFDISTRELGQNSQPGDQFFGIHVSSHDRVMIFAGGIPLTVSGVIVGASAGAFIQASISSRAFRTTGIAFGWIAPISFRKPFRGNLANPRGTAGNDHRLGVDLGFILFPFAPSCKREPLRLMRIPSDGRAAHLCNNQELRTAKSSPQ